MKKEILNLGKVLSKNEQKIVNGGSSGCYYSTYQECMAAGCNYPADCVQYNCNRVSSGYLCYDPSNNT